MSSKVTGGGGLGDILRKLIAPSAPAPEAQTPSLDERKISMGGDVFLGGTSAASRLSLAAAPAAPASARDQVGHAQDLNDLIGSLTRNEFPGLKLTPMQAAGLTNFIREQLADRGITDGSFKDLKSRLS